jgi:hypothetical protein
LFFPVVASTKSVVSESSLPHRITQSFNQSCTQVIVSQLPFVKVAVVVSVGYINTELSFLKNTGVDAG